MKSNYLSILAVLLSGGLTACGGGNEASALAQPQSSQVETRTLATVTHQSESENTTPQKK